MNYLFFDAAIGLVLLIFLWRGYARGFVLTLCGFLALFVALLGASFLSGALAEPVGQAIVPVVERGIRQALEQSVQQSGQTGLEGQLVLPEDSPLGGLLALIQDSEVYQELMDTLQSAVDQGVADATAAAARLLAGYAAVQIARGVLFCLCFVGVLAAWFLLSHALDLVARLPVLSTLNHWGGGAVGLLKGALVLFIAAWLFQGMIPPQAVEQTKLLRFFCTASPLTFLTPLLA